MDQRRSLLVLRHAQTEDMRPGRRDVERRLTANGERQAAEAGEYLRKRGIKRSTPEAVGAVDGRFPAAALAELEFDGKWSRLDACSLLFVWLPAT
ncbi:MAG TPA: histidine phosphatase family protein [Propionibacteriaceae bacterium]|nr:histidine phosphatase family protein [Propionibacteriaceae bacterium]